MEEELIEIVEKVDLTASDIKKLKKILNEATDKDFNLNQNLKVFLFRACLNGHSEIIKILLEDNRLNPTESDKNGLTPFKIACLGKNIVIVKALLEKFDSLANEGKYQLSEQASNKKYQILEGEQKVFKEFCDYYLAEEKNISDKEKQEVKEIQELFLRYTSSEKPSKISESTSNVSQKDNKNLKILSLVKEIINICKSNDENEQVFEEKLKELKELDGENFKSRINHQLTADKNATILHIAVTRDHKKIAKILIENGADPDKVTSNGLTPFFVACAKGHLEIVKLLINSDEVDINRPENNGIMPFDAACAKGYLEIVKLIINSDKFDINKLENREVTPFDGASAKGHLEIVKLLINSGKFDINKARNNEVTPLYVACMGGHYKIAKLLIENGLVKIEDLDKKYKKGDIEVSAFDLAMKSKDENLIRYLNELKKTVKSVDLPQPIPLTKENLEKIIHPFSLESSKEANKFYLKNNDTSLKFSIAKKKGGADDIKGIGDNDVKKLLQTINGNLPKDAQFHKVFDEKQQGAISIEIKENLTLENPDLIKTIIKNFIDKSKSKPKQDQTPKEKNVTTFLEANKDILNEIFKKYDLEVSFGNTKEAEFLLHGNKANLAKIISILKKEPLKLNCEDKTVNKSDASSTFHISGLKNPLINEDLIKILETKFEEVFLKQNEPTQKQQEEYDQRSYLNQQNPSPSPSSLTPKTLQSENVDHKKNLISLESALKTLNNKNKNNFELKLITKDSEKGFTHIIQIVLKSDLEEDKISEIAEIFSGNCLKEGSFKIADFIPQNDNKKEKQKEDDSKQIGQAKKIKCIYFNFVDLLPDFNHNQKLQSLGGKFSEVLKPKADLEITEDHKNKEDPLQKRLEKYEEELKNFQKERNATGEEYFKWRYLTCAKEQLNSTVSAKEFLKQAVDLLDESAKTAKFLEESGANQESKKEALDQLADTAPISSGKEAKDTRNITVHSGYDLWKTFNENKKIPQLPEKSLQNQTISGQTTNLQYAKELCSKVNERIKKIDEFEFEHHHDLFAMVIDLADIFIKYKERTEFNKLSDEQFKNLEKDQKFKEVSKKISELRLNILREIIAPNGNDKGENGYLRSDIVKDMVMAKEDKIFSNLLKAIEEVIPKTDAQNPILKENSKQRN